MNSSLDCWAVMGKNGSVTTNFLSGINHHSRTDEISLGFLLLGVCFFFPALRLCSHDVILGQMLQVGLRGLSIVYLCARARARVCVCKRERERERERERGRL